MSNEITDQQITEGQLVMVRQHTDYGYSNTWWRVLFIDNDKTFVGRLERKHWHEYKAHQVGETEKFNLDEIKRIYQDGEKFCYGDKITICDCPGLCREK